MLCLFCLSNDKPPKTFVSISKGLGAVPLDRDFFSDLIFSPESRAAQPRK